MVVYNLHKQKASKISNSHTNKLKVLKTVKPSTFYMHPLQCIFFSLLCFVTYIQTLTKALSYVYPHQTPLLCISFTVKHTVLKLDLGFSRFICEIWIPVSLKNLIREHIIHFPYELFRRLSLVFCLVLFPPLVYFPITVVHKSNAKRAQCQVFQS